MDNIFVLMMLTASIGLNIFFMVMVIPGLKKFGPTYCLQLLKAIRLTLKRVKHGIPNTSIESLIEGLEKEIDLIQTHIDGHKYTDKH